MDLELNDGRLACHRQRGSPPFIIMISVRSLAGRYSPAWPAGGVHLRGSDWVLAEATPTQQISVDTEKVNFAQQGTQALSPFKNLVHPEFGEMHMVVEPLGSILLS
ncbi:hypothetical protein PCANC_04588 [Puccinia coronata f. sp. avenae]|uniref:Uncharacterized protein n=1 Tax=Puccinia coronata f. sp. avenae TaxID=200324 RepID=A0A2N5VQZ3_9BASI|nr:hypothetical protein PCANC_21549 [Puccinia coronata f. sp. avenae]PLW52415.1 hypothetical protein PCASD_00041 [Puccinia coronata f. sp. avenae]PLW55678.1 hypothetical protein PCANC_04588 [Puccinia coronata f. sp. avenae]